MSSDNVYYDSVKSAREAQQKYDYYFLGVVLATLSISIQVFAIGNKYSASYLLVVSWCLWLISLFSGMIRLQKRVSFMSIEAQYLKYKNKHDMMQQAQIGTVNLYKEADILWAPVEIDEELKSIEMIKSRADGMKEKDSKHAAIAFTIMQWCFFAGLVSFVAFRIINLFPAQ